jgi:demethylmenaquinone methyltransferase/2-methoxy-6-polyprenyl-1,4-benzoquinol methylase
MVATMTPREEIGGRAPDRGGADAEDTTDFGYRRVSAAEKPALVRDVFDSVAGRYDLMNDLMSGGIHRLWKAALVAKLNPRPPMHFVDVAGGTGDIAFRILDRLKDRAAKSGIEGEAAQSRATIIDINQHMLEVGRDRSIDRGLLTGIDWVCGDATALPLDDSTADAYTIAFGIRNVTGIEEALAEARRVLKPGGRFLCLEFCPVDRSLLRPLYDAYSFAVVPALGRAVAGDADSYRYLVESIRRFPGPEKFSAMMEAAGLEQVRVRTMTGGLVALYSGWRL